MTQVIAILEISSLAFSISALTNALAARYLSYSTISRLQKKIKDLSEFQKQLLNSKDDPTHRLELDKFYEEMQGISKELLRFQVKSLAINLIPFFLGFFLSELLFAGVAARLPGGLPLVPTRLSGPWIYILAYAAFNSLLAAFLNTLPGSWDHAKALAEKQ